MILQNQDPTDVLYSERDAVGQCEDSKGSSGSPKLRNDKVKVGVFYDDVFRLRLSLRARHVEEFPALIGLTEISRSGLASAFLYPDQSRRILP
jgi:hypothetical protein